MRTLSIVVLAIGLIAIGAFVGSKGYVNRLPEMTAYLTRTATSFSQSAAARQCLALTSPQPGKPYDWFGQAKAVPPCRQAVNEKPDSPELNYALGRSLDSPFSTPTSRLEGIKYISKAANAGMKDAQASLGGSYFFGLGVAQDKAQAAVWYRKAAEQGLVGAQYSLGSMYLTGDGVKQDSAQAAIWLRKAAEQGEQFAQFALAQQYEVGSGTSQDLATAARWYAKAADQGNGPAQFALSHMYSDGRGVPKDDAKAFQFALKAAEQGDADAQATIGYDYEKGLGVAASMPDAFAWYKKSADQNNSVGQYDVGAYYQNVPHDLETAKSWYHASAAQGYELAKQALATLDGEAEEAHRAAEESSNAAWASFLDKVVTGDSYGWAWNRYSRGSMSVASIRTTGSKTVVRANFRYANGRTGSVTAVAINQRLDCIEYGDIPGCRRPDTYQTVQARNTARQSTYTSSPGVSLWNMFNCYDALGHRC